MGPENLHCNRLQGVVQVQTPHFEWQGYRLHNSTVRGLVSNSTAVSREGSMGQCHHGGRVLWLGSSVVFRILIVV